MDEASKDVLRDVWTWVKYVILTPIVIFVAYNELLFEFVYNRPYILFVALAAALNACMDVVTHHYETSIFKNKDVYFFNPDYSWIQRYAKMPTVNGYDLDKPRKLLGVNYPFSPDFWHFAKAGMIFSLCAAICLFSPYVFWIDFLFIGYVWNITFGLFYDKILRGKN